MQSNQTFTDADLIQGCIQGDRRMQKALYDKYAGKMYAVCLRYMGNADDAQDILQDGFIKVYKNLERFRGEGSFEGWVRRIFVNTAIEQIRKKKNDLSLTEKEESIELKSVTAIENINEKDLMKVIKELSPGYRAVFNLYVVEGYSHKEIGELLGISEGTSKSQLARARMILQEKIKR
ncbi:RNA polymerase sigma-70 factor (ECF subfamily) [Lacibacter cauensis]|uniref:RNA polymerase sigma-70 factor (ECF subfamily) n=1 Tax=Lacibacter cauensis TaxID=510947 RepID=A0A562SV13_9BACT|nr:RNA polymerase sigma factor [Lacibacter cauensis]TWI84894.1 RNA polymerase sigma-70 factor (ECF subfamily) [Lacibacter cauensis]